MVHDRSLSRLWESRPERAKLVLICIASVVLVIVYFTPPTSSSRSFNELHLKYKPVPALCAHRIIGDESDVLGPNPVRAMRMHRDAGVQCFDADVVRLKDDTFWVSHPRVFEPYVKLLRGMRDPELSGDELLLAIETLTAREMEDAEAQLPPETVRPALAADILAAFAQLFDAASLAPARLYTLSPPRLLLEPKGRMFDAASISSLWHMIRKRGLQDRVALYAVDAAHYGVLMEATEGQVEVVWGYMDQDFSDQVSSVPFPAPVPPDVPGRVTYFAIAKGAPMRYQRPSLGLHVTTMLWNLDTEAEYLSACNEGADIVITNRATLLSAAAARVKLRCARK